MFASANALSAQPLYHLTLVADSVGPLMTNGGLALQATHSYQRPLPRFPLDTLLVAGGSGVMQQRDIHEVKQWLREVAPSVRRLGSICSGAFLLAAAGLLDGCRVTTHWRHAAQLAAEYPALSVEPDALYIESHGRYTSAGVTAGIDLALSLLEDDHGSELAGRVARELVVFLQRPGGSPNSAKCCAASNRRGRCVGCWIGSMPTPVKSSGLRAWPSRWPSPRAI